MLKLVIAMFDMRYMETMPVVRLVVYGDVIRYFNNNSFCMQNVQYKLLGEGV